MTTPRAHALLSASSSARWLACTPAPSVEAQFPEEGSSVFAQEGTVAHALAELMINERLRGIKDADAFQCIKASEFFSPDMEHTIGAYVDYVAETFHAERAKDAAAQIFTEQRVDFSSVVPDGFGTSDVVIIREGRLTIIDLKFGKGVPVSAKGNPQMRLYAVGALAAFDWLFEPGEVVTVIHQPRLDSVSVDTLTREELMTWARDFVAPRAQAAASGTGEFVVGEHCRFCKARHRCRARAEAMQRAALMDFKEPALLSDDEVADVLSMADALATWAKDVKDYAQAQALQGKHWSGWKLVAGQKRRKIIDEDGLTAALREKRFKLGDIAPRKLLTIGKLERLVGKDAFAEISAPYVETPEGDPILVRESDRRAAVDSVDSMLKDFNQEA